MRARPAHLKPEAAHGFFGRAVVAFALRSIASCCFSVNCAPNVPMSPHYKPPMSPTMFVAVFVVLVVGSFTTVFFYEPPVAGDYEGIAEDLPMGASGPIALILSEADGRLSGTMILPPSMPVGGGAVVGTVLGDRIAFITTDEDGRKMTWAAGRGAKTLSGRYWWGELDEARLRDAEPLGVWSARLR